MAAEDSLYLKHDAATPFFWRVLRRMYTLFMPVLGWPAFVLVLALSFMPAFTLRSTEWIELGGFQSVVDWSGPLAIITMWILLGWGSDRFALGMARWTRFLFTLLFVAAGFVVILQMAVGWLPGPVAFWQMWSAGDWLGPVRHTTFELGRVVSRSLLWWQGVQAGDGVQDNLVVSLWIAGILWLIAGLSAGLARKTSKGLIIALPPLWIVLMQLAYTSTSRSVFVYALVLAILLHLILDHRQMTARWMRQGMDYNPGIGTERLLVAGLVVAAVIALAAIFPNIYVTQIAQAYYDRVAPFNEPFEGSIDRAAPDVQGVSRMRRGMVGGLPNDFLLQGGPDLRQIEVMRYRTDEPVYMDFPFDEIGPPGHYMRGGTYAVYNGRGWGNPAGTERRSFQAEERRPVEFDRGRRELVQSIVLQGPTQILYAAPEIVESSVGFRLETRGEHDIVAAWARERSYTVVSETPAVSETELRELPPLNGDELASDLLAPMLQLPDTVSERTRELALALTEEHDNAFDKAAAIEAHLRTYEYDLSVPAPPGHVEDIADYFLFDLQRGYCDYYASAFVVLARLAGLPARFATGFAAGYWDPMDMTHVVTEADAHSWAEVYFPEVGWIPFEPTAAQPLFSRLGTTTLSPGAGGSIQPLSPSTSTSSERTGFGANWQVWLWMIPLGFAGWGVYFLLQRRGGLQVDPWTELLAWGRRLGRPIDNHETPLEYGHNLGDYLTDRLRSNQDTGRLVAREMKGLGADISDWRYGPETQKPEASRRAASRWARLRDYRRVIRLS